MVRLLEAGDVDEKSWMMNQASQVPFFLRG
jgi:hypothetical protein